MSLIIIIGCIWGICKLISAASAASRERARQAEIERVRRAQERQRAEQQRIREEWKAAQAAERERVRQMEVIEREQARQRAEQARITKEQERQAAQLAKHDEMIAKLMFVKEEAERAIAHLEPQLSELKDKQKRLEAEIRFGEERFGLRCDAKRRELERVSDRAFSVETKLNKARFNREQAARKMAA